MAFKAVDMLITHAPPQRIVSKHWDTPDGLLQRQRMFGVPVDWTDPSLTQIEWVWSALGRPPLYCGHMHCTLTDGNVHILNINEVRLV